MSKYYARNDSDVKFDTEIREEIKANGNRALMALYKQNQEILNLMRTLYDMRKGYVTDSGYMGWIDSEKRWRLFATEEDYKDYILEVE